MKQLNANTNMYPIGITGIFEESTSYLNILGDMQRKLIQIISYCRKYNKSVVIYLDEKAPFAFYNFLYSQGLTVKPVIKDAEEDSSSNTIKTRNIGDFLDRVCEVLFVVCSKENKDELEDFETATKLFITKPNTDKKFRLVPDPALTLRDAVKKAKQQSDPYSVFFHEKLYEVVPYNYYDEIMQTMPDLNTLTNREFANAKHKESKNNRKI